MLAKFNPDPVIPRSLPNMKINIRHVICMLQHMTCQGYHFRVHTYALKEDVL